MSAKSGGSFKKYLTTLIIGAVIITIVFYFMGALDFGGGACPESKAEDVECPECEDCPECPEPECKITTEKCRALFGMGEE